MICRQPEGRRNGGSRGQRLSLTENNKNISLFAYLCMRWSASPDACLFLAAMGFSCSNLVGWTYAPRSESADNRYNAVQSARVNPTVLDLRRGVHAGQRAEDDHWRKELLATLNNKLATRELLLAYRQPPGQMCLGRGISNVNRLGRVA